MWHKMGCFIGKLKEALQNGNNIFKKKHGYFIRNKSSVKLKCNTSLSDVAWISSSEMK